MTAILAALGPVTAVIALGYAMRRAGFPGDGFWAPAERLAYYLLLPTLVVRALAGAPLAASAVLPMTAAMMAAIATGAGLMLVLRRHLGVDGPAFSSLFQGAIRLNGFIGLAAAAGLHGEVGLSLSSAMFITYIPLVNLLSVTVLTRHAGVAPAGLRVVARALLRNPLIIACVIGGGLAFSGIGMPAALDGLVGIVSSAALPVGLLCVGAGLSFRGLGNAGRGLAAAVAVKLAVVPLTAALVAIALGLSGPPLIIVALWAGLPTATSAYILARQMGGDAGLMAQTVGLAHVFAAVTLPAILLLVA